MTSKSISKFCFLSCLILLAFSAMPVMAGLDMPGDSSDQAKPNQALNSANVAAATAAGATTAVVESAKQAASSGSKSGGGGLGGLLSGVTKGASGFGNMLGGARNLLNTANQFGIKTGNAGNILNGLQGGYQIGSNVASGIQGGAFGRLTGDLKNAGTRFFNTTQAVGIQPLGIFRPNATQTAQGRNSLLGGDMGTMRNNLFQINQASAQVNQYRPSEIRSTTLITAANGGTNVTRNNDGSIRINGGSLPVVNVPSVRSGP